MSTLHLFTGAPKVTKLSESRSNLAKSDKLLWKQYHFKAAELIDNNVDSLSEELSEILLEYEFKTSQCSSHSYFDFRLKQTGINLVTNSQVDVQSKHEIDLVPQSLCLLITTQETNILSGGSSRSSVNQSQVGSKRKTFTSQVGCKRKTFNDIPSQVSSKRKTFNDIDLKSGTGNENTESKKENTESKKENSVSEKVISNKLLSASDIYEVISKESQNLIESSQLGRSFFQSILPKLYYNVSNGFNDQTMLELPFETTQTGYLSKEQMEGPSSIIEIVGETQLSAAFETQFSVVLETQVESMETVSNSQNKPAKSTDHNSICGSENHSCCVNEVGNSTCVNEAEQTEKKSVPISESFNIKNKVNLLAVILQINPVKNLQIKKGPNVGENMSLSSILIGDESYEYFKVTLWHDASNWIELLAIGDVILLKNITLKIFKSEKIGQTTATSKLFNFHRPTKPYPVHWNDLICLRKLEAVTNWINKKHKYLYKQSMKKPGNDYVISFNDVISNTLMSFSGVIVSINVHDERHIDKYQFLGLTLPKVSITLRDVNGFTRDLFIWGKHYDWLTALNKSTNRVMRCRNVFQDSSYTFHTTCKSTYELTNTTSFTATKSIIAIAISLVVHNNKNEAINLSLLTTKEEIDVMTLLRKCCNFCQSLLSELDNDWFQRCTNCNNNNAASKLCFTKIFLTINDLNKNVPIGVCCYGDKSKLLFPALEEALDLQTNNQNFNEAFQKDLDNLFNNPLNFSLVKMTTDNDECSLIDDVLFVLNDVT